MSARARCFLARAGIGFPACDFSNRAAAQALDDEKTGDVEAFCLVVLFEVLAENLFETFWTTLICIPIVAC